MGGAAAHAAAAEAARARLSDANRLRENAPWQAWLVGASRAGHEAALLACIGMGADARLPDASGNTPLHHAARFGHASLVTPLVQAGADVAALNAHGWAPLHLAALHRHARRCAFPAGPILAPRRSRRCIRFWLGLRGEHGRCLALAESRWLAHPLRRCFERWSGDRFSLPDRWQLGTCSGTGVHRTGVLPPPSGDVVPDRGVASAGGGPWPSHVPQGSCAGEQHLAFVWTEAAGWKGGCGRGPAPLDDTQGSRGGSLRPVPPPRSVAV
ncbi:hypothetical protein G6F57_016682 [Rhizopus arrhizus]|nr:hypothetical protein G6F57_016682 [Rhizopus arrhizus]